MNLVKYNRPKSIIDWGLDNLTNRENAYPPVDVRILEAHYILEAELPGYGQNDVEITLEKELLILSSRKEKAEEQESSKYLLRERKNRAFKRSFVLPKDADKNSIAGEMKNGLLVVTIAKAPEAQPIQIEIKSAGLKGKEP